MIPVRLEWVLGFCGVIIRPGTASTGSPHRRRHKVTLSRRYHRGSLGQLGMDGFLLLYFFFCGVNTIPNLFESNLSIGSIDRISHSLCHKMRAYDQQHKHNSVCNKHRNGRDTNTPHWHKQYANPPPGFEKMWHTSETRDWVKTQNTKRDLRQNSLIAVKLGSIGELLHNFRSRLVNGVCLRFWHSGNWLVLPSSASTLILAFPHTK